MNIRLHFLLKWGSGGGWTLSGGCLRPGAPSVWDLSEDVSVRLAEDVLRPVRRLSVVFRLTHVKG